MTSNRTRTHEVSEPNGMLCSCQHCKFNQLASHQLISNAAGSAVFSTFQLLTGHSCMTARAPNFGFTWAEGTPPKEMFEVS